MRRLIFTILVSTLFWTVTNAQVHYPVRTYTTVTAPAPYGLDGFISTPGKLNLQIVVDDISLQEHPVKLRLFIKGSGINIYTRPNYTPQPVYLDGGLTEWLTGEDLRELFNPQHLIFEGYSKNQYQRSGRLPEGVYRVGFEVVDYHRNVVISQSIPAIVMMYLSQAPRLIAPRNTEEIDPAMTPALRFSWLTPGISNPLADVTYRFRLWQIRPKTRASEEIVRISRPHFQTETSQNWFLYDATLPPLESGMDYVWEVEAVDREGLVIFKNEGKSDISTFSYGQKCPVPLPYFTQVSTSSASVRWNYNPAVQFYRIFLRKTGEESGWEEMEVSSANHTIKDLEDFCRYEMKVISVCNDCESDESGLLKFRTNRDVDYFCGAGSGNFDLSNTNPLLQLKRFDIFKAADFLIEVETASGENGIYSGTGLMVVPYLNFLKFKVHFHDISINTDYRMISGEVFFVYDEETGMVLSEEDFTPDAEQTPGYQEVNIEDALKEGTDHQVNIDGEVADITVEGNKITITTTDGETQTVTASENQTVGVSPSGGTQAYVADTSSGRVYSFPKKSSGSPNEVRSSVQSGVYGGKVSFSPSADQRYGLDVPGAGRGKPDDYFDRDKSGNLVSWKSLESGMVDYVDLSVEGDLEPDSLRYIRSSGFPVPASPLSGRKKGRSLLLTGGMNGDREMLSVARATQKSGSDGKKTLTEVGALGLATYGRKDCYVKLIQVHDAVCPDNAKAVEDELNRIYSPAVVNWKVSIGETISPDELPDLNYEDFQTGNVDMLKRYTDEMKRVYKHYKRTYGTNKNTQYLFFIKYPDADKKGFMPLTGQYGFIFNFGMDFEIMAHELAHGAFNLRHPFSPESSLKLGEGTSDNLMDYGRPQGIGLWKPQWDLIHNPEKILFSWSQDESEGAMEISGYDYSSVGYGGAEAIQNHIFKNKDDIISIVKDFGMALTPDVAAEILISYYKDVEILNSHEAYGYLVNLLKYDRLIQITKNKERLIQSIGNESDDQKVLAIIRRNIDTTTDLALDLTAETYELVAHLLKIYNVTKEIPIDELKRLLPTSLNSAGKKELLLTLSNTKFKELLRSNGITKHKDVQELINLKNARSRSFYVDSRINVLAEGLQENQIAKLLDSTSDLGIIDVSKNESNLTSPIYDKSVKLQSISNVLEITGYAVDLAIAFKNIANGQDLEPADLLFMIPGAPEMVKSIVNNMSIEPLMWENELPWMVIKKWNIIDHTGKTEQEKFGIPGHLYLQYTQNRGKANPNIYPTSFIFLDSSLANEVFGFGPIYVNYNNENGFSGESFYPQAQSDKIEW